ncbi:MAG: NAD/NADP octopine/nopaline dehydrogenase family protein [Coprobacillaceae bacterium]
MLNDNKIAVISSGNGGQSMAAYFANRGYTVSLYVREKARADMFPLGHIFKLRGVVEGDAVVDCISNNMQEVIKDAHLIMVTTPAQYHHVIAQEMSDCLEEGQMIVLNPGRTFGTYVFKKTLEEHGNTKNIILAEAETFVFACRCARIAEPFIHGMKKAVHVAAHNPRNTSKVVEVLELKFPGIIKPAKSTRHTSFSNIGVIFHPLPILLNITRVETKEKFRFYKDGITPLVANIIEQMDRERVLVAKAYGVEVESAFDWLANHYGSKGDTLYERIQNTEAYANIYAPTDIDTRYIYEDILTGCVPLYYAGKAAGVEMRIVHSVILWASTIYATDFIYNGRNDEVIDFETILKME